MTTTFCPARRCGEFGVPSVCVGAAYGLRGRAMFVVLEWKNSAQIVPRPPLGANRKPYGNGATGSGQTNFLPSFVADHGVSLAQHLEFEPKSVTERTFSGDHANIAFDELATETPQLPDIPERFWDISDRIPSAFVQRDWTEDLVKFECSIRAVCQRHHQIGATDRHVALGAMHLEEHTLRWGYEWFWHDSVHNQFVGPVPAPSHDFAEIEEVLSIASVKHAAFLLVE